MPDVEQPAELDSLPSFDFDPRTRVVFGSGTINRLGALAKELHGTKVLLVTDPGIERAGHSARGIESLRAAGLDVVLFQDVQPNPTTDDVDHGLAIARERQIDLIVAIGGGSAMDCAKGINFLLTNGGTMQDYLGIGKATRPMLPLIAVPTTAGTGSEAQSFALIADARTHMKMACGDKKAACRVAILDPDLTISMPASVTAATGIDAISHALESYVTTRRNPISTLFARRAWRLLSQAFPIVTASGRAGDVNPLIPRTIEAPTHSPSTTAALPVTEPAIRLPNNTAILAARGNMLLGAHLAGAAIENSMLGATHALANPLTAHYGVTHGLAIGIMLPHVVRYNASTVTPLYGRLAADTGICELNDPNAGEQIARFILQLTVQAGLPTNLRECGVDRSKLSELSVEASKQWTGTFNPRPVSAASLQELYEAALDA